MRKKKIYYIPDLSISCYPSSKVNIGIWNRTGFLLLNQFKLAIKPIIAIALLIWLVQSDYLRIQDLKLLMHPLYLPLAFIIFGVAIFLQNQRFRILLSAQGLNIQLSTAWKLHMVGQFFNFVLPGGVSGDLVKAYYIKKNHGHASQTSPYTVLFDRVLGVYTLLLISFFTSLFDWNHFQTNSHLKSIGTIIVICFLASTFFFLLATYSPVRNYLLNILSKLVGSRAKFINHLITTTHFFFKSPKALFSAILLSVIAQLFILTVIYMLSMALGRSDVPLSTYIVGCSIGFLLTAIPISPGGIGVGQAAFLFIFTLFLGESSSLGPTLISGFQAIQLVWSLQGLYYWYQIPNLQRRPSSTV